MITGESRAVAKQFGDPVIAGTVAAGGALRVRVPRRATRRPCRGSCAWSRTRSIRVTGAGAGRWGRALLFYVALAAGAMTLAGWWLLGDPEGALIRTATVLVIACPHALGLAIPLVIAISTSLGARNGLLVKDRLALERARTLDTVIFDKTGTLTKGEPALVDVAGGEDRLSSLAAAVEADSEHPLARAIVEGASSEACRRRQPPTSRHCRGGVPRQVEGRTFASAALVAANGSAHAASVAADWDSRVGQSSMSSSTGSGRRRAARTRSDRSRRRRSTHCTRSASGSP